MKQVFKILALVFLAQAAQAQITIERSDYKLDFGSPELRAVIPNFDGDIPDSGENMVWDYSEFDLPNSNFSFGLNPVQGSSSMFPEANWVQTETSQSTLFPDVTVDLTFFRTLDDEGARVYGRQVGTYDEPLVAVTGVPTDKIEYLEEITTYEDPLLIAEFPMNFGDLTGPRHLEFVINNLVTATPFGLFQVPAQVISSSTYNYSTSGWGTLKVKEPVSGLPVDLEVLLQVEQRFAQANYFLGGQPAPPIFLGVLGLTDGSIEVTTRYEFWTKGIKGPAMRIEVKPDGSVTAFVSANLNEIPCLLDLEAPELNCQDQFLTLDEDGIAQTDVNQLVPGASDECSAFTFNLAAMAFDCSSIGSHNFEIVATDEKGNSSSCTATVTIFDNDAPMIGDCPNQMVVEADNTDCYYVFQMGNFGISDNCSVAEVISNFENGDELTAGTYFPQIQVVDNQGNVEICSFTLQVEDNGEPQIDCPDDIEVISESGAAVEVDFTAPITDACGFNLVSISHFPGDSFEPGTTTVTIEATDNAGNDVSCEFDIEVMTEGVINCPGPIEVSVENAAEVLVNFNPAIATTLCDESLNPALQEFIFLGWYNGHRYFLSDSESATWQTASFLANDAGGYLAIINDERENEFLTQMLGDETSAWIGLSDLDNDDDYNWEGMGTSSYTNFFGGSPFDFNLATAVFLENSGHWSSTPAFDTREYLIEIPDFIVKIEPNNDNLFEMGTTTVDYFFTDRCEVKKSCSFEVVLKNEVAEYCQSTGQILNNNHWIARTKINGNSFNSGNNDGYENFTNAPIEAVAGEALTFEFEPNSTADEQYCYFRAWIDWNEDGDFYDEHEMVFQSRQKGAIDGFLSLPPLTSDVKTRLRISMSLHGYAAPCGNLQAGEIEDYSLEIKGNSANNFIGNTNNGTNAIHSSKTPSIQVFPNPTTGIIHLNWQQFEDSPMSISILNTVGQEVWYQDFMEMESANLQTNLSEFPTGIYWVQVTQNGEIFTEKVILK